MRSLAIFLLSIVLLSVSRAGLQQDFFATRVLQATRVRVVKIGPDKTADGALSQHVLLDSAEKKKIEDVVSAIEMIDPRPEKKGKEEEVWTGSILSFGVAEYLIEFYEADQPGVRYGMSSTLAFVTPLGAHAPQGTELQLDYSLTSGSAAKIKRLIGRLQELRNQRPEGTPGESSPSKPSQVPGTPYP